ncbi:ABC transporter substrate-binding protein [Candidatus Bipolaricaulota bacterium]|nr:ABC transporter substrate-binding protein [Candidatus Bipolaricaulota bacterium]
MWSKNRLFAGTLLVVLTLLLTAGLALAQGGNYERSETLYTTGNAWSPPTDWNPITNWNYATGTIGLCFETPFLYDSLKDEMKPWLAKEGEWVTSDTYMMELRRGVEWQDGEEFTAEDVKFTFELGERFDGVYYSTIWNWLDEIVAIGEYSLEFRFSDPLYQQWDNYLYSIAIVPEHRWSDKSQEDVLSAPNKNPIGTGAYRYETHDQDRMVWVRNEDWWASDILDYEVAPKYVVDIVNRSNNVSLGMLLQGEIDWSNNFLPGVPSLVENYSNIHTYYKEEPYMLSENTAFLFLNLTKKPMDDPDFRKATAFAIDTSKIVSNVYGNIVKASGPTGLLPNWSDYVDEDLVDEKGFSFDPEQARKILEGAGYEDVNNDGFREAPDGSSFELTIIVPNGWTDWMQSIRIVADGLKDVGINATVKFPDFGNYSDQLYGGTFDMAINNFGSGVSNSPFTFYEWLFQSPIKDSMSNGNFGRYENQEVFDLVTELNKTPTSDDQAMKETVSDIQDIFLTDLPAIPLWFNGMWFQANTDHWKNWPSGAEDTPDHMPSTWSGNWEMGGLLTLTELEPAK